MISAEKERRERQKAFLEKAKANQENFELHKKLIAQKLNQGSILIIEEF